MVLDIRLGWVSFGQSLPHVEAPALDCTNVDENAGNVKLFGGRKKTGKGRLQGAAPGRGARKGSFHLSPCSSPLLLPTNHCRETPGPSTDTENMGDCASPSVSLSESNTVTTERTVTTQISGLTPESLHPSQHFSKLPG